jgi:hypothetical protein
MAKFMPEILGLVPSTRALTWAEHTAAYLSDLGVKQVEQGIVDAAGPEMRDMVFRDLRWLLLRGREGWIMVWFYRYRLGKKTTAEKRL